MSKKTEKKESGEKSMAPETEQAPAMDTEELTAALEKERALSEDYKRKWYSVTAEYDNYRKRTASQSAQRYREGRQDVVSKLFPIADNLELAVAACADGAT